MAAAEQPYDPYIPAGSSGAAGVSAKDGNQRTAALQAVSPFPGKSSTFATYKPRGDHICVLLMVAQMCCFGRNAKAGSIDFQIGTNDVCL
jgi:hypothetical protein